MVTFDLGYYCNRFPDVLQMRYGQRFDQGFKRINYRFESVRNGRPLEVDDVMALFDPDLPFVQDWSKPDRQELERKMWQSDHDVPTLIHELGQHDYDPIILKGVIDSLRELSLVALILHHVYPARFAIVSHHLASTLHVTGQTVPSFYISYCNELDKWRKHHWQTPTVKTVADTEFALWCWYRLAYSESSDASKHRDVFFNDRWIQTRRAERIAQSLGRIEKLDLARSYLLIDPTVAAMIAWREVELEVRDRVGVEEGDRVGLFSLIDKLKPWQLPHPTTKNSLKKLWKKRNVVMHEGYEMDDAREIVSQASAFLEQREAR